MDDRFSKIDIKSKIITDGLGNPIDEGIRELIVLLNYHYIGTTQSCWGHKNWGLPYPWFDIDVKYYKNLEQHISEINLEIEELGDNTIRIIPKSKTLINGRREFNKLKNKLSSITNHDTMS